MEEPKITETLNEPDITKTIECRVGRDYRSRILFISELNGLDSEIAEIIAGKLNLTHEELHGLTANLIDLGKKSKYGDGQHGLTRKVLRLAIEIKIKDCELIDDEVKRKKKIKEASE